MGGLAGCILAIDVSNWLYQAVSACQGWFGDNPDYGPCVEYCSHKTEMLAGQGGAAVPHL